MPLCKWPEGSLWGWEAGPFDREVFLVQLLSTPSQVCDLWGVRVAGIGRGLPFPHAEGSEIVEERTSESESEVSCAEVEPLGADEESEQVDVRKAHERREERLGRGPNRIWNAWHAWWLSSGEVSL